MDVEPPQVGALGVVKQPALLKRLEVRLVKAVWRLQRAKARSLGWEARLHGGGVRPVSGFRTMAQQKALYAAYRAGRGNLAARPGYSNHQGGTSVDVSTRGSYSSPAYKWLARHGRQYGFVNDVRGEPWHWTYRG